MRDYVEKHFMASALIFIALMTAIDYAAFHWWEFVWPFFLLPYIVMLVPYLVTYIRQEDKEVFHLMVMVFVIFPVFAGLIMSLAWMIKINFWGEVLGRLVNR